LFITTGRIYNDHRRYQTEAMAALQPKVLLDLLDYSNLCTRAGEITVAVFKNLKSASLFPYEPLSLEEYRERFEDFKMKELKGTSVPCKYVACICRDTEQIKKDTRKGLDEVERSVKSNCLDCIIRESTGATASVARSCRVSHA
jgi:hypothetical protein